MNCPELSRVSEWVDGELSRTEVDELSLHLESCAVCRSAADEYGLIREDLRRRFRAPDSTLRKQAFSRLVSGRPPLWRRTIAVPGPAVAAAALCLMALALWVGVSELRDRPPDRAARPVVAARSVATARRVGSIDFTRRFDRGERAVMYKETRP